MTEDFETRLHTIGRAFDGLRASKKAKRHKPRKGKQESLKCLPHSRKNLAHPREDNESADITMAG